MRETLDIVLLQQKINSFVLKNQMYQNSSLEEIISVMIETGYLNINELKILEENSLFNNSIESKKLDRTAFSMKSNSNIPQGSISQILSQRLDSVSANLKKAKDENGIIGGLWSGFKNLTGIGASSNKVEKQIQKEKALLQKLESNNPGEAFKELTGLEYTPENMEKLKTGEIKLKSENALGDYVEGQDMSVDIGADIISGIAALGIYTLAIAATPFTGGASIAVGIAAAAASGAAIKAGVKGFDAVIGGREYNTFGKDLATGAFSGLLAPVTGGLGGAVGKTAAKTLGLQAARQVGKEVATEGAKKGLTQGLKTALTNPTGYVYTGGTKLARGVAYATEMATDGALGGGIDNAFKTAIDGGSAEEILNAGLQGAAGGLVLSPVIGGSVKYTGSKIGKLHKRVSGNMEQARHAASNNPVIENPDIQVAKDLGEIIKEFEQLVVKSKADGTDILNGIKTSKDLLSSDISDIIKSASGLNSQLKSLSDENKQLINEILSDLAAGIDPSSKISKLSQKGISINEMVNERLVEISEKIDKILNTTNTKTKGLEDRLNDGLNFTESAINDAAELGSKAVTQAKKIPETNAFKILGSMPDKIKSAFRGLSEEAKKLDADINAAKQKIANGNVEEGVQELKKCYSEADNLNLKVEKQLTELQSSAARAGLDESIAILAARLEKIKGMDAFSTMTKEQQIQAITENSNILFAKFAQTFSSDDSLPKELTTLLKQFTSNCTVSRNMSQAQSLADELYGAGKYTLVKSFGAGTIGETYLAKTADGKEVVIKMLKDNVSPEKFAEDRMMFVKYIDEFTTDATEKEYKRNLINSMFDAWDRELDFGLEAQGAKDMANGAKRFKVAQTLEVGSKNGRNISLVMEKASGVPLDKLLRMLKLYKENPTEYITKYADEIAEFPALKSPDNWMKELELTYQRAQNEQAMFVNSNGQRTIHADPHAGNIFVDFDSKTGKPEIVYIDTGNVINRNTSETLKDVGLSLNMMIGNSKGIAEAMLDGATLPGGANKEQIAEQFAKLLDERLFKADINLKNTQYTQNSINQIMKELNIIPNSSNSNLMKATLQRIETARGIRSICGNTGNEKIANIKDLGIALIKAFKTDPKEAWKTLKPILIWAIHNQDQAMVTFFQMILRNTTPPQAVQV